MSGINSKGETDDSANALVIHYTNNNCLLDPEDVSSLPSVFKGGADFSSFSLTQVASCTTMPLTSLAPFPPPAVSLHPSGTSTRRS